MTSLLGILLRHLACIYTSGKPLTQSAKIIVLLSGNIGDVLIATPLILAVASTYPSYTIIAPCRLSFLFGVRLQKIFGKGLVFVEDRFVSLKSAAGYILGLGTCSYLILKSLIDSEKIVILETRSHPPYTFLPFLLFTSLFRVEIRWCGALHDISRLNSCIGQELLNLAWPNTRKYLSPLLPLIGNDWTFVRSHLDRFPKDKRYVVLHPFSTSSNRIASINQIVVAYGLLEESSDCEIVLVGVQSDLLVYEQLASKILSTFSGKVISLIGTTSFSELLQVISNSRAVIATDSGVAHAGLALAKNVYLMQSIGYVKESFPTNHKNLILVPTG